MICKRCKDREVELVSAHKPVTLYYSNETHTKTFIAGEEPRPLPASIRPSVAVHGVIPDLDGYCYYCKKVKKGLINPF